MGVKAEADKQGHVPQAAVPVPRGSKDNLTTLS